MIGDNDYIYKKEVDWSLLNQGLSIPVHLQMQFSAITKKAFSRGTVIPIKILLENNFYDAKLVNQKFDKQKYPNHKDIVQIRYESKSLIAQKMREIFVSTYNYCLLFKKNDELVQIYKKRVIPIHENQKEYLLLYTTSQENTFLAECITKDEITSINYELSKINEDEFESSINYNREDTTARIEPLQKLIKVRKLNRAICDNLKKLYGFRCQITGENFCESYGTSVVEAHHIDYFVESFNNNSNNILIVSPNYHRLIHKLNPIFDRRNLAFKFPNGLVEKIKLNVHL